jgi:hypothetical protein
VKAGVAIGLFVIHGGGSEDRLIEAYDFPGRGIEQGLVEVDVAEQVRALVADVADGDDRIRSERALEGQIPLLIAGQPEIPLDSIGRDGGGSGQRIG